MRSCLHIITRLTTRFVGKLVPAGLLTYFAFGWYSCTFHVGYGYLWIHKGRPSIGFVYILLANVLIGLIARSYLHLLFLPRTHSTPPIDPPPSYVNAAIIETAGGLRDPTLIHSSEAVDPGVPRCWRGNCGGRWKPPKTRHCRTCGTCQIGFDHHCPWVRVSIRGRHWNVLMYLSLYSLIIVLPLDIIKRSSTFFSSPHLLSSFLPFLSNLSSSPKPDSYTQPRWRMRQLEKCGGIGGLVG